MVPYVFLFCVPFYCIGYFSGEEPYVPQALGEVPIRTNHDSVHNIAGL